MTNLHVKIVSQGTGPDQASKGCFSSVLALAEAQMARQKAILFTKTAKLYTRFRTLSLTPPWRYPSSSPKDKSTNRS